MDESRHGSAMQSSGNAEVSSERVGADGCHASRLRVIPHVISAIPKAVWAVGGFICFAFGSLGLAVPVVPTTPFLLAAAFCFARSSRSLDRWFKSTKLYAMVFESYLSRREMTLKAKTLLLVPLSAVFAIALVCMSSYPLIQVLVGMVWLAHMGYFGFMVKTMREKV